MTDGTLHSSPDHETNPRPSHHSVQSDSISGIVEYDKLKGPTLLKETLGLHSHRHGRFIGSTGEYEPCLLDLNLYDEKGECPLGQAILRKVSDLETFQMLPDEGTQRHQEEFRDLDAIEAIVAPYGQALINLYFRIVHPSFPILHKKVYLEKYSRTWREFSPPLLAATYILALNWWSYSDDLAHLLKPNVSALEELAFKTMNDVIHRPKISTVQAGLLLLQRPKQEYSWAFTGQIVAVGQDLGLHLDCSAWTIPQWEIGLRKRLGWALFMQDTWASLIYGRPPHISRSNWAVKPVTDGDFPESAADEDDEDGSTGVETGRTLFARMVSLSEITREILEELCSWQAGMEIQGAGVNRTKFILEKAKPLQLKLKLWHAALPESLQIDNIRGRKLCSTGMRSRFRSCAALLILRIGYLYLAYFTTEITLHRNIVRSLSSETDPFLKEICRSAARDRLIHAIDFFKKLKPEQIQSFWYFASKVNFALIGTFNSLLWITSQSKEEADFYQQRLQEYRWALRVSSKSAEFLEIASGILDRAVAVLVRAVSKISPDVHNTPNILNR